MEEKKEWYRMEEGETSKIDIFDEIGFWGITAQSFQRDLDRVAKSENISY